MNLLRGIFKNNKYFVLILVLAFLFGSQIQSTEVNAKTYYYEKKTKKKTTKMWGNKPVTSKWLIKKEYWYTSTSKKKLSKYQHTKRKSNKQVTYLQTKWFHSNQKVKQYRLLNDYGKVAGKWQNKYYKLSKYDKAGKKYAETILKKRSNGKYQSKEYLKAGVRKRYNYDTKGVHQTTYQYKSGKWVLIWKKADPKKETPTNNPVNPANPAETKKELAYLIDLVNAERNRVATDKNYKRFGINYYNPKVKQLTWDPTLQKAANIRAKELVIKMSHSRPNGDPGGFVCDDPGVGCDKWMCGEPAVGSVGGVALSMKDLSQQIFESIYDSKGHYDGMVSEYDMNIAIGWYYYDGAYYWSMFTESDPSAFE